jgi:predicted small secreted protein
VARAVRDVRTVEMTMRKIVVLALSACLLLSACETLKGVGRDVENAGEAIDDAIDDE